MAIGATLCVCLICLNPMSCTNQKAFTQEKIERERDTKSVRSSHIIWFFHRTYNDEMKGPLMGASIFNKFLWNSIYKYLVGGLCFSAQYVGSLYADMLCKQTVVYRCANKCAPSQTDLSQYSLFFFNSWALHTILFTRKYTYHSWSHAIDTWMGSVWRLHN